MTVREIVVDQFESRAFWSRVQVGEADDCWRWLGPIDPQGYGHINRLRCRYRAHRVAYVLSGKPLSTDRVVDHLCRNRACVNPAHLDATTVQMNTARGIGPTSAAATVRMAGYCINGHKLSVVGLHKQRDGFTCAECGRERVRRYQARVRCGR